MINIAVCDDEINILTELEEKIKKYMKYNKIEFNLVKYIKGEHLIESENNFDIILLDIKMNGINGIETAKIIRKNNKSSSLIFTTNFEDYVFEAFDVEASNYLLKPIDYNKLYSTFDKIIKKINTESELFLYFKKNQYFKKIKLSQIKYIEVLNHTVYIYSIDETNSYNYKIEDLEKQLNNDFFRCHRSYIINFNYVKSYKSGLIILSDDEKIPVAKRRQKEFLALLLNYYRNLVR